MIKKSSEKSRRSVRRDPGATRAAILKSAVSLFEQQGYDATSVSEIVDLARCTKGAFYYYFDSKEVLLHDIHDGFIDYQLERARDVLTRDVPADELLAQFVTEVLMEPMGRYQAEITVYLHEQRFLAENLFQEIRVKREEFAKCVLELVERGVQEGIFKDLGPARVVAFGIIGMSAWTHTWMKASGALSPTDIGDMFGKLLIDGLRRPNARTAEAE